MRKPNYRQAKNQREAAKAKTQQERLAKRHGQQPPNTPPSGSDPARS